MEYNSYDNGLGDLEKEALKFTYSQVGKRGRRQFDTSKIKKKTPKKKKTSVGLGSVSTKRKPIVKNTKRKPIVKNTKRKPIVKNTKRKPIVNNIKRKPIVKNTKRKPIVNNTSTGLGSTTNNKTDAQTNNFSDAKKVLGLMGIGGLVAGGAAYASHKDKRSGLEKKSAQQNNNNYRKGNYNIKQMLQQIQKDIKNIGSKSKNTNKDPNSFRSLKGLGLALGAGVALEAGNKLARGVEKKLDEHKMEKVIAFAQESHPELKKVHPGELKRWLKSAYVLAPQVATDKELGANMLAQTYDYGGKIDLSSAKLVSDIGKNINSHKKGNLSDSVKSGIPLFLQYQE